MHLLFAATVCRGLNPARNNNCLPGTSSCCIQYYQSIRMGCFAVIPNSGCTFIGTANVVVRAVVSRAGDELGGGDASQKPFFVNRSRTGRGGLATTQYCIRTAGVSCLFRSERTCPLLLTRPNAYDVSRLDSRGASMRVRDTDKSD